nr:hypothetical protein [Acidobacteriota bacterium]
MNAVRNRALLVLLGPVAALVMFAGAVNIASASVSRASQEASPGEPQPVQSEGLAGEKLDAENKARARATPYVEAEYRTFPVVGSRVAIWAVAQLHLLFAAFVLAVPIF